jgi:GNAT superfamily N-acetyltransferase
MLCPLVQGWSLSLKPEARVLIRLAAPPDASEVASVLWQSFVEYQDRYTPEGFAATTPDAEGVRSRLAEWQTWVALLDNAIVGTASAFEKSEGCLHIRGMAVLPSARGQKVGELLLREIEGFALRNRYTRLSLSTTPFLSRAIRLYERFGFQRTDDGPYDICGTPLCRMAKALHGERDFDEVNRKEDPCHKTTDTPPAFA